MERGDDSWVSASKCLLDWLKEFSTALWVADCRRAGGGDASCRGAGSDLEAIEISGAELASQLIGDFSRRRLSRLYSDLI